MASRRAAFDRIRITKVGFWYAFLTLVVGLAAANTGNNALYLVEAMLLGLLAVSGVISRRNLQYVSAEVRGPDEIYARQPFSLSVELTSTDRWWAKRLLVLSTAGEGEERLVPRLERRGTRQLQMATLFKERGRHTVSSVRLASIFPLGLIFKSMRLPVDLEVLVFPEIQPADARPTSTGRAGEQPSQKAGWGHELLTLREFRPGDDPRGIHWKQSARTGRMVYMEREAEHGERLSIVFDNAVGELSERSAELRFERLVSEAASAAEQHLERGHEVQLVTREGIVPFGRGQAQRLRILEELALIQARPSERRPLESPEPSPLEFRAAMTGGQR